MFKFYHKLLRCDFETDRREKKIYDFVPNVLKNQNS